MRRSCRREPCPCCGRTKTSHCAWILDGSPDDVVLCHNGERYGPPPSLAIGDVHQIDGRAFALTAIGKGFAGSAHVFRPHQPRKEKGYALPNHQRRANAQLLAIEPLQAARLDEQAAQLATHITLAFQGDWNPSAERLDRLNDLHQRCRFLLPALRRALRSDPGLTPAAERLGRLMRQLVYEQKHLSRWLAEERYRQAWGPLLQTQLEEEASDWAFWQQQKASPNHPWVQECWAAAEEFWTPVKGESKERNLPVSQPTGPPSAASAPPEATAQLSVGYRPHQTIRRFATETRPQVTYAPAA